MRILLINPNNDPVMTNVMRSEVDAVKRPETAIEVVNAAGAPVAIESGLDEVRCLPGILEHVERAAQRSADPVVLGYFCNAGVERPRELTDLPVVGSLD